MAGYPPPYPPMDYKAQRRAAKAQLRAQRDLARLQMRAMRRGSIVGPLFLVALGVVFLLVETGRMRWWPVLAWYARWWPVLIIGAGCVLAAEWALDQHAQQNRAADGLPLRGARTLGGGAVWLLILLGLTGALARFAGQAMTWDSGNLHFNFADMDKALGDPHDSDGSLSEVIPADGSVAFDNARGDVTVSGTSDDGQMHIAIHKQVYAFNDGEATTKAQKIQPVVSSDGGHFTVTVPVIEGGHADLTVQVPRTVAVTVSADRGEVRVNGIHAPVVVNGNKGSVDLSGLDGSVSAHLHSGDATFSAHSITGPVTLDGRTGDLNVSDIHGSVALTGDFFGATHMERVNGPVHFHSSRTDLQMGRLDGELELDTGSDLRADQLLGPVVLTTRQRNITLDRVQGDVRLQNRDGSVSITSALPLGSMEIVNKHGSVDVGVPASAGFALHATTRHGDVENDFSLPKMGSGNDSELNGTVGHGGATIQIQTTDGDVTVRKSIVQPLTPVAPAPPQLTEAPAAPSAPAAPRAPVTPRAQRTPARPAQLKAPSAPSGEAAWIHSLTMDTLGL